MRTPLRNWSLPLLAVCLVGCLVIGAVTVGAGVVAAEESYDLTVSDAVEVPTESVDDPNSNDEFEIDAFAVREPGESLEVTASVPDDAEYYLDLYNSDQRFQTGFRIEGSETVTFEGDDTADLEPGTYSLVLQEVGGSYQAVHPVVISGYDISEEQLEETGPDQGLEVTSGGTLDLQIDISPEPPSDIEVVLWNENITPIQQTATQSDGGYSTSIDVEGLETGTYNLHIAVLGDEEFQGKPELLGLSGYTIEVAESESENGETEDDDGPSNGDPVDNGDQQPPVTDDPPNEPDGTDGDETDADPDTSTETVEVVDTDPDTPGIHLPFENTTVRTLIFANESASGNVTVMDRSTLPTGVTTPEGTSLRTVEITVPHDVRNDSAILEFAIEADVVNDTDALSVERYDPANETWTVLNTTVSETTASTVTVVAETPGFSLFSVTETVEESASTPDSNSTSDERINGSESESGSGPIMPNETDSPPTPEDQSGFGVFSALAALVLIGTTLFFRRSSKTSNE